MEINEGTQIGDNMPLYTISKEYYSNITPHQREQLLNDFDLDADGNIVIPYEHKGYKVNESKKRYSRKVKAKKMRFIDRTGKT